MQYVQFLRFGRGLGRWFVDEGRKEEGVYVTQRMVSLKPIHPQTRPLNLVTKNSKE